MRAEGQPRGTDGGTHRRLVTALQTMPVAFVALDADFRVVVINTEGERLAHGPAAALIGRHLLEAFPEATAFERQYRRALESGRPLAFEEHYRPFDSWFEVHAWPDHQGGVNIICSDITKRRMIEHARSAALDEAEQANARLAFLTDLSARLGRVDTELEVFQRLCRAVVPVMADWCTVVVPQGDELVRVAARHRDPTLNGLAARLVGAYPEPLSRRSPGVEVYRSGEPRRLAHLAREMVDDLDASAANAAFGRTLQLLGDGPALIVPVSRAGQVVAVLTSTRTGGEPFDDDDLAAMGDAALRVSTSLDDVQVVQTQRDTASALQAAALPPSLPVFDGVELAAGYRAATEGSQVGGDWYDAFALQTGRIALVVGDAAGHGWQAAAVMAQMRNALRAQLFDGAGPAAALTSLSSLLAAHEPDAFATIVCVELDPMTGDATWASAGHPPPVLVRGDGTSAHLRGRPGPPIGWVESLGGGAQPWPEHGLALRPSDRLVLFTDGLIERRGIDLDVGLAHLMLLAERTRGDDAAGACEAILHDVVTVSHEDDVCLLVADLVPAGHR